MLYFLPALELPVGSGNPLGMGMPEGMSPEGSVVGNVDGSPDGNGKAGPAEGLVEPDAVGFGVDVDVVAGEVGLVVSVPVGVGSGGAAVSVAVGAGAAELVGAAAVADAVALDFDRGSLVSSSSISASRVDM